MQPGQTSVTGELPNQLYSAAFTNKAHLLPLMPAETVTCSKHTRGIAPSPRGCLQSRAFCTRRFQIACPDKRQGTWLGELPGKVLLHFPGSMLLWVPARCLPAITLQKHAGKLFLAAERAALEPYDGLASVVL